MAMRCLVASHGYPPDPGLVFHQEQSINRVTKMQDYHRYVPGQGASQEMVKLGSLNLRPNHFEVPRKFIGGLSESDEFVKIDSTLRIPVFIDGQETRPDSVLFNFGMAEQYTRHEKIFQFLMSGSSEAEGGALELLLSDLMGLQALTSDVHQRPLAPSRIHPSCEFYAQKPFMDFVGEVVRNSKNTIDPDGRVLFTGSGTEMKDLLSFVADFYLSKDSSKWRKQTVLVPHFNWMDRNKALANIHGSYVNLDAATVAPLKSSPEKSKLNPSQKKKSKKGGRERNLYELNYFHACESLLALMVDQRRTILPLKKSGPELPDLLTHLSAGIAGTGLAVLFSVIGKLACGTVPFCVSKVCNAGLGFGLLWLSLAVNRLRDTIVYTCKNASKLGLKDEEMMRQVDKTVKEIYFRAATLMAVALLRLA
ncbi:hypothetical protein CFOL_v3_22184 [Cephalotus follicularis]|uniref:Uncharacterized protein n=1 Tax=Cephalotus follicularis TaxID=3775 RepID=A0A1Q3CER4_CEPFO|nr:hypothetical protein CFOL_v3_22184 [Cephalotus follicularis]